MSRTNRYVGVFGPRAAGKTVYLTVLSKIGHLSNERGRISVPEKGYPSSSYLSSCWKQLNEAHEWLSGTPLEIPKEIVFEVTDSHKRDYLLHLPDACGELMDRIEHKNTPTGQEKKLYREELKENYLNKLREDAHGIAIFIPSDLKPGTEEARQLKEQFDPLFDALKSKYPNRSLQQPIAIIVTKWDEESPNPESPDEEEKKAQDYLKKIMGNFVQELEELARDGHVKVFPVSSTGPVENDHEKNITKPKEQLKPFQIKRPIFWLLSTYETSLVLNIEEKLAQKSTQEDLSTLRSIQEEINTLLQKAGTSPERGSLEKLLQKTQQHIHEIEEKLQQEQKQHRRQVLVWSLIGLTVFSLLVLGFFSVSSNSQTETVLKKIKSIEKQPQLSTKERIKHLKKLKNDCPYFFSEECASATEKAISRLNDSHTKQEFLKIPALSSSPTLSELRTRKENLEQFIKTFGRSKLLNQARKEIERIAQILPEQYKTKQNRVLQEIKELLKTTPQSDWGFIDLTRKINILSKKITSSEIKAEVEAIQQKINNEYQDFKNQEQRKNQKEEWDIFLKSALQTKIYKNAEQEKRRCKAFEKDPKREWMKIQIISGCTELEKHGNSLFEREQAQEIARQQEQEKAKQQQKQKQEQEKAKQQRKQKEQAEEGRRSTCRKKFLEISALNNPERCYHEAASLAEECNRFYKNELTKKHQDCLQKADDDYWNTQVYAYRDKYPTDYKELYHRIRKYLAHPVYSKYAPSAKTLLEETRKREDQDAYEKIAAFWKSRSNENLSISHIEDMKKKCNAYIHATHYRKKEEVIKKWLRWHQKIEKGIDISIFVFGIQVTKQWVNWVYGEAKLDISISIGRQRRKRTLGVRQHGLEYSPNQNKHDDLPLFIRTYNWRYTSPDIEIVVEQGKKRNNKKVKGSLYFILGDESEKKVVLENENDKEFYVKIQSKTGKEYHIFPLPHYDE